MNDIKENAKYERRKRAREAREELAKKIVRSLTSASSTSHFYINKGKPNEPNKKNH